jgi:superfamily II DNA helicase RecQ
VVVTNIETFRKEGGGFEGLWKNPAFVKRVISIVWDEGHCVSRWADMRPEYKDIERLRYLLPKEIPFYVTSATLPPLVLHDVMDILHIRNDKVEILQRSNDRPNVHLIVRQMVHPAGSFLDLAFLIPEKPPPGWKPPKFLIFFDNIAESIAAAKFLRGRLPLELRWMIKWFNADMSAEFREQECDNLKQGVTWGLCCTDSFGMVSFPQVVSCLTMT